MSHAVKVKVTHLTLYYHIVWNTTNSLCGTARATRFISRKSLALKPCHRSKSSETDSDISVKTHWKYIEDPSSIYENSYWLHHNVLCGFTLGGLTPPDQPIGMKHWNKKKTFHPDHLQSKRKWWRLHSTPTRWTARARSLARGPSCTGSRSWRRHRTCCSARSCSRGWRRRRCSSTPPYRIWSSGTRSWPR